MESNDESIAKVFKHDIFAPIVCRTSRLTSSALGPPALKISAGILSFPDVLLEVMAEMTLLTSSIVGG